ncbi:MAG: hypothetical protein ABIH46_10215, partial [Chloroflexota bacterium]
MSSDGQLPPKAGSVSEAMTTAAAPERAAISPRLGVVQAVWNYIEVLKPRETALLTFIGVCAAIIAGRGYP